MRKVAAFVAALFLALFLGMLAADVTYAQAEPALLRARGVLVAYDAETLEVSVRERKVVRVYAVIPEGDDPEVETRVSIEGSPARLGDLEAGAPIMVSWRHDPSDADRREAVRLEVPKIPRSYREDFR